MTVVLTAAAKNVRAKVTKSAAKNTAAVTASTEKVADATAQK